MRVVPLRLRPGDDLRQGLEEWMVRQSEAAGCVLSGLGGRIGLKAPYLPVTSPLAS